MDNSTKPLFELQWTGVVSLSDYDTSAGYYVKIKEKIRKCNNIQLLSSNTSETDIFSSLELNVFDTVVLLNFNESTFEITCYVSKECLPRYNKLNLEKLSIPITKLPEESEDLLIFTSPGITALYTTYKLLEETVQELSTSKSISLLGMNILTVSE